MLHSEEEHLHFYCDTFSLMLPLRCIAKVILFDETLCSPTMNSVSHHGQSSNWQNIALPYIDLRIVLGAEPSSLPTPAHIIVLCNSKNSQPVALVAIDDIKGFITPLPNQWHQAHGINKYIDTFFDRLYVNNDSSVLTLRLGDPTQWINDALRNKSNLENHHAH